MNKILSIIVPTYNMESLLKKGIDSLIIVELIHLIEIIIVNDGSTDSSLTIANEYKSMYPDSFIIIDKPNGNYGSCINVGLKKAQGKYIKIMDADDSFCKNEFKAFIKLLENTSADVIFNNYIKDYGHGRQVKYRIDITANKELNAEDLYQTRAFVNAQLPAITYRKSIFDKITYYQLEGYSYTDMQWCFLPLIYASTVYSSDLNIYNYNLTRDGQTMSPNVSIRQMSHRIKCMEALLCDYAQIPNMLNKQLFACNQIAKQASFLYRFYLLEKPKTDRMQLEELDKQLKVACPKAYEICGQENYRLHIPYKYVIDWRQRKYTYIPWYFKVLKHIFDIAGNLRIRLGLTTPDIEN